MERNVGINTQDEVYVVLEENGDHTVLGFDTVLERITHFSWNLAREPEPVVRGSLTAYDVMKNLEAELVIQYNQTGEEAIALLSPQLTGLEGRRVEVVDEAGDEPRQFTVGKSIGPLPIHLELHDFNKATGRPARPEYHSVREL